MCSPINAVSAQSFESKFEEISTVIDTEYVFSNWFGFVWIDDEGGLVKYY